RIFSNPDLPSGQIPDKSTRARMFQRFVRAGIKEPYRFYLPLLDIDAPTLPKLNEQGDTVGVLTFYPSVAGVYADEIIAEFAPKDRTIRRIVKRYYSLEKRIQHLKKWLQS